MIAALAREWRLLAGPARLGLVVLAVLASVAVALGLADAAATRTDVARVRALEARETQSIAAFAKGDAGEFGYYRNFPVWRAPGDLAFLAPTRGDAVPAVMRIRILALEGQINDNEAANPELLLTGRFDFAFVTLYLAPLLLIALLHDLWSGEREAGRLAALDSLPRARHRLWSPRVVLRAGGVALERVVVALGTAGGNGQLGHLAGGAVAVGGELAGLGGDALAAAPGGEDDRPRFEDDALAAAVQHHVPRSELHERGVVEHLDSAFADRAAQGGRDGETGLVAHLEQALARRATAARDAQGTVGLAREGHAELLQPAHRRRSLLGEDVGQHRVGRVVRRAHDVVEVRLDRIVVADGGLDAALCLGGVARGDTELGRDRHARAGVVRGDRGGEPGPAGADHEDIGHRAQTSRRGRGSATTCRSSGRGAASRAG